MVQTPLNEAHRLQFVNILITQTFGWVTIMTKLLLVGHSGIFDLDCVILIL